MTNAGATAEIYCDYVKYVKPNSIDDLVEKMLIPWSQSDCQKLQNHILTHYQWDQIAQNIINEYKEIIER